MKSSKQVKKVIDTNRYIKNIIAKLSSRNLDNLTKSYILKSDLFVDQIKDLPSPTKEELFVAYCLGCKQEVQSVFKKAA